MLHLCCSNSSFYLHAPRSGQCSSVHCSSLEEKYILEGSRVLGGCQLHSVNNKMIEHHNVAVYHEMEPKMFRGRWWSVLSVDASCCMEEDL